MSIIDIAFKKALTFRESQHPNTYEIYENNETEIMAVENYQEYHICNIVHQSDVS